MFADKYYFSTEDYISEAIKSGQRVTIDLENGNKLSLEDITAIKAGKVPESAAIPVVKEEPKKEIQVALIVTGLGVNEQDTNAAIELPAEAILSFSPYGDSSSSLSRTASEKGHETAADLPMQVDDPSQDAGNLALKIENNDFRNAQNLEAIIQKIYKPIYVVTSSNEVFSQSDKFNAILREVAKKGLYLIYASSKKAEGIENRALDAGLELFKPDYVITDPNENLSLKFGEFEDKARKSGYGIIIVPATSSSITAIAEWYKTFPDKKLKLVPSL